jgi:preprotein translocase subunit SecG
MANVLLVIQLLISIVLTFLILIQRSEGGALGIGGGGGGGLMSGRSATNSITKLTAILGAAFIVNCLILSIVFNKENQSRSLIDVEAAEAPLTITTETPDNTNPLGEVSVEAPEAVKEDTMTSESTEAPADTSPLEEPKTPENE